MSAQPSQPLARQATHWLLGHNEAEGFAYAAHEIVCTNSDVGRWCALRTDADVTVCGRHAPVGRGSRSVEVFATCDDCGQALRRSHQSCPVPKDVAVNLAANFWRLHPQEVET